MSTRHHFSSTYDKDGEYVTCDFELRSQADADKAIKVIKALREFINPSTQIHALAAAHFVDTPNDVEIIPTLRLVA